MIQILFNRTKKINDIIPPLEIKQLIFMVKKMLPALNSVYKYIGRYISISGSLEKSIFRPRICNYEGY